MFGKDALDLDKYFRSLQFDPIIDAEYEALSPANKSFLQAYADGVNAYVKTARIFPIEFKLIGMDFAPWTVKDSLHVFKLLSFMMASHWQLTSVRSGIADKYGPELAELLVPFREKDSFFDEVTIIPETGEKKKQEKAWEKKPATPEELKAKINGSVFKELPQHIKSNTLPKGSNAWAVHGNHTVSGKPILSNDPHLAHGIPSEFYMVALKYPQGPTITGATLSGLPLIVIGRNEKVAWGVTMSLIENVDLYNIKLNTEKTHYFYNGAWKPLKIRQEIIKVKGGEPIKYLVYATHHGPIMDYPLKPELGLLFAYLIYHTSGIESAALSLWTSQWRWRGPDCSQTTGASRLPSS